MLSKQIQMASLLDKMLTQKKATSQSITNQINIINEISKQSNNLLVEMEAERSNEANNMKISENMKAYKYSKKMDQVLPKVVELYKHLNDDNDGNAVQIGFADFLQQSQQNNQYLSNNVRKAVVVADILQKVAEDEPKKREDHEEF